MEEQTEIELVADGLNRIARAIYPTAAIGCSDAAGVHVESLTEAIGGVTAGLMAIADAINELAVAVSERD